MLVVTFNFDFILMDGVKEKRLKAGDKLEISKGNQLCDYFEMLASTTEIVTISKSKVSKK